MADILYIFIDVKYACIVASKTHVYARGCAYVIVCVCMLCGSAFMIHEFMNRRM